MTQDLIDQAIELMKAQRFGEALVPLQGALRKDPSSWGAWYMAGQCYSFTGNVRAAITHLARAADIKRDDSSIFLALGIAFQLDEQWDKAVEAFRSGLELNPDDPLLYNSLALTQKKRGEVDKALHNYDAGVKALARTIIKGMKNSRTSPIFKHRDTAGTLWVQYAVNAAIYLASKSDGISQIAWPTGEQAMDEERTEKHAGFYWEDVPGKDGGLMRVYLPNFFNTFREALRRDSTYSNLIGNRGTALEVAGQQEEAQRHFDEAGEFLPR